MSDQLGFAEAFLGPPAGGNRQLERIAQLIGWVAVERILPRPEPGPGHPPYPALAMFKALLLAQWYGLSDPGLEQALSDRLSFRRFAGFGLAEATPGETTICRFRNALGAQGMGQRLLEEINRQLDAKGLFLKRGTMIDATLIEAQAARPRGDARKSTVDPDAAFAKKGKETCFGYKGHAAVDEGTGLVRGTVFTPANVADTAVADDLVQGDEKALYADAAYATHARRARLKALSIKDRIMHRPNRHHKVLPRWQARRNRLIAPIRSGVERLFGTLKRSYRYVQVRYFSLASNAFEFDLKCLAYNLRRADRMTEAA